MPSRPSKGLTLIRFEVLVTTYRHRIYGYACHYLGDAEEAADVTQDVLVRLWKNRDGIDEEHALAWLLRVTRNACVDVLRRRSAYRKRVETSSEMTNVHADPAPGPDREASSNLFQEKLISALETLGEPYKSIVILREIEEYTYEEICAALDLPLNTVKVYLHRARKALRKQLTEVSHHEYA